MRSVFLPPEHAKSSPSRFATCCVECTRVSHRGAWQAHAHASQILYMHMRVEMHTHTHTTRSCMHVTPELPTANTGTHALICESLTCLHFCRQRRIEPHSAISRLTIHATMNQKGRIPASLMCASNIMSTCLHMLVIPEKASASAFFATCLLSNVCCCSCVIICNKICA